MNSDKKQPASMEVGIQFLPQPDADERLRKAVGLLLQKYEKEVEK